MTDSSRVAILWLLPRFLSVVCLGCGNTESAPLPPEAPTSPPQVTEPAPGGGGSTSVSPAAGGEGPSDPPVMPAAPGGTGGVGGNPAPDDEPGSMPVGGQPSGGAGGAPPVPVAPPFTCPPGPYPDSPLPEVVPTPEMICDGFEFTEGAVWIESQEALFFSNFEEMNPTTNFLGDIVKYTPGVGCETLVVGTGTNGLAISPSGNLLGASHLDQDIKEWDLNTLESAVVVSSFMDKAFSSPNDITLHDNGTMYFTDPAWQLGQREEQLPQGAYYKKPGEEPVFIEALDRANGISLSPDQTKLYISGSYIIRSYELDAEGIPSAGADFLTASSDGMVVDCAGNLYLTSFGVSIYSPAGTLLGMIQTPPSDFGFGSSTANLAFGGPDKKTLFINLRTQVMTVELEIPGYPY